MSNIYAKAYAEVYEILRNIPEEDLNKIPNEVLHMLEIKRDKGYKFQLQENIEFENQKLLRETKVLLAILYRNFPPASSLRNPILTEFDTPDILLLFLNKNSEVFLCWLL